MFAPFPRVRMLATVCLLAVAGALPLHAEEKESKGDKALYDVLRDVINRGANLYNNGDPYSCYRLFEGALMVTRVQLASKPDLQKAIDAGMAQAEKRTEFEGKAYALRDALDKV